MQAWKLGVGGLPLYPAQLHPAPPPAPPLDQATSPQQRKWKNKKETMQNTV